MSSRPNLCPFCRGSKVLPDIHGGRLAIVCQRCRARGPEVPAVAGNDAALKAWNNRINGKYTRITCPVCKRTVCITGCGIRYHVDLNRTKCPASNKQPDAFAP